jgi:hypothetical protein
MSTTTLTSENFRSYPPQAQSLVAQHLALFQELPRAFLMLLLREIIAYDWKFPAERDEIDRQLRYLNGLSPEQLATAMSSFTKLKLPPELEGTEWIGTPSRFSERLSAYLWATHQIDDFSNAAESYIGAFNAAVPEISIPAARMAIVVIGHEISETKYPLFRKLRDKGTYFTNVDPGSDSGGLLKAVADRADRYPAPYAHWAIYGADTMSAQNKQIAAVAYSSLSPVRADLIRKMQDASALHLGPEAMRTRMAETDPSVVGIKGHDVDAVMSHFSVSVLAEGAGTQIYSTTFVQWTAREALRRARPLTLMAKFTPRQTEESADEELQGIQQTPTFDYKASLVDADMGAYYTWINLQRLSRAEDSTFLAWFEGHQQAIAISPALAAGKICTDKIDLTEVLHRTQSAT